MRGWLLDTNVIAEMTRPKPDPRVQRWFVAQPEHMLLLSILTLAEYQKGLHHLQPGDPLRPRLERLALRIEERFSAQTLSVSDAIVLRWGAISGEVKRVTGHSPAVIDTLLAATAIEHSLYLA
ncbi:MAG: PIN domain-containing protein, partial [Terracidiphilus sp.]|nr:PIN domain-containing protein [Terracidiphilus sp.]